MYFVVHVFAYPFITHAWMLKNFIFHVNESIMITDMVSWFINQICHRNVNFAMRVMCVPVNRVRSFGCSTWLKSHSYPLVKAPNAPGIRSWMGVALCLWLQPDAQWRPIPWVFGPESRLFPLAVMLEKLVRQWVREPFEGTEFGLKRKSICQKVLQVLVWLARSALLQKTGTRHSALRSRSLWLQKFLRVRTDSNVAHPPR